MLYSQPDVVSDVVTLRNEGNEAVEIVSLALEGTGFTAASAAPLGWLAAGEEAEFWVEYSPVFVEDTGWITIESSDSTAAIEETLVPLRGQGAYPLLVLDPPLVDFGWVEPEASVDSGITLRNEGLADLTVTETLVVGADFSASPPLLYLSFSLQVKSSGWTSTTLLSQWVNTLGHCG